LQILLRRGLKKKVYTVNNNRAVQSIGRSYTNDVETAQLNNMHHKYYTVFLNQNVQQKAAQLLENIF